jgi:hypothetical protein
MKINLQLRFKECTSIMQWSANHCFNNAHCAPDCSIASRFRSGLLAALGLKGIHMGMLSLVFVFFASSSVFAQAKEVATSESRDAAVGYIGTTNFIVGRVGRDCLALLGRSETPQDFVAAWQQRNSKYLLAVDKYLQRRLAEAYSEGGEKKRDAVLRDVTSVANANGAATVRSWLDTSDKMTACKRAVSLVDMGAMDITSKIPMFGELEALREWSERQ